MIVIFIGIISLFFVIFCLKYPKCMFLFVLFFIIVWPDYIVYKYEDLPGLTPSRFFLLLFSLSMLIRFILCFEKTNWIIKKIIKHKGIRQILLLLIAFFTLQIISSILNSHEIKKSLFASTNNIITGFFLTIFVIYLFNNKQEIRKIIYVLLFCGIFINIVAMIEWINNRPLFMNYLLTANEYTIQASIGKMRDGSYRLMSVFSNALVYAHYLLLMFPLGFYLLNISKNIFLKFITVLYLISNIIFVVKTGSRAGLLLIILTPLIFYYFNFMSHNKCKIKRNILNFIIIIIGILFIFWAICNVNTFVELTTIGLPSGIESSTIGRIMQYEFGIHAFFLSPLLGYGVNEAVKLVYPFKSIDSYFLTILLEVGFLGLFIYIYFNIKLFKLFLNKKSGHFLEEKYIVISIAYILIFYTILSIDKISSIYFVLIGMGLSIVLNKKQNGKKYNQIP